MLDTGLGRGRQARHDRAQSRRSRAHLRAVVDGHHAELNALPETDSDVRVNEAEARRVVPSISPNRVALPRRRERWMRRYVGLLVLSDLLTGALATTAAFAVRFPDATVAGPNLPTASAMPFAWVALIALSRGYEARFVGVGSEEFRRFARAFFFLAAAISVSSYITRTDIARGFVLVALPLALVLGMLGRFAARWWLRACRSNGKAMTSVLLVGDASSVEEFTVLLRRDKHAGMHVVGACVPNDQAEDLATIALLDELGIPLLGDVDSVLSAVDTSRADTVAVVSSSSIGAQKLRWISWQLEGRTTDLVVVPGLAEVAGTRLHIQPVAGLPLLHVDEPEFAGIRRVLKGTIDRTIAVFGLIVASPILLLLAAAVRLDSRGPAFFRQTRVGLNGETFTMIKFRSMYVDAEERLAHLQAENDHGDDHVLFKMKDDPRITKVGKWLRKLSLDELPQLFNVAFGTMSLVGPRPPLPSEVARYEEHVHRRLLVKPGVTGLWQVSGRSNLAWDESVRLDLRYVENWSITGDLLILWKTLFAVAKREGAF